MLAYTYENLPASIKIQMKDLLKHTIGDKSLSSDELLLEARCHNVDEVNDTWSKVRAFCDLNVIVTTLFELAKEGAIECVQASGLKDWNPKYRLSMRHKEKVVAVEEDGRTQEAVSSNESRLMKISKPWKKASKVQAAG